MTNDFLVRAQEIGLVDEADFLAHGGQELHFGALDAGTVLLSAAGSPSSIGRLARCIIAHRTAA